MIAAPSVDIVVPVYESLRHVRSCIGALGRWTDQDAARLIIVDDASSLRTHRALAALLDEHWVGGAELVRNDANLGFLQTANRGMQTGSASTIVLLNSDAIATTDWLDGLIACLHHAPDVAFASPLSNHSNLTTIRGYYGADHLDIAAAVRKVSPRRYPNIHLATGFCMAMRRTVVEELGFFDERYGRGYFEESDLSLRAAELGWRVVADDATYLHHHGWGSFGAAERDELMARNLALFEDRWGVGSHRRIRQEVLGRRHFMEVEQRVAADLTRIAQPQPRRPLPQHASRRRARNGKQDTQVWLPSQSTPTHTRRTAGAWQEVARQAPSVPTGGRVRDLLLLLDELTPDPMTTQILRLADELAGSGMAVSIATAGRLDPSLLVEPCRLRPFVLAGPDELLDVLPPHRLVVALSPRTVYDALLLKSRDGSATATWFEPQEGSTSLGWPGDAFAIARAPLLADHQMGPVAALDPLATQTHVVPQGVCLDTYGNRDSARSSVVLIPHDRRAGPTASSEALLAVQLLAARGLRAELYGDELVGNDAPWRPFAPQQEEAATLGRVAAVLEVGPVPGVERLRLRCAAARTPLIAAGPIGPTCALVAPDELHVAPRGDVRRMVDLAGQVVEHPEADEGRLESARQRAEQAPIAGEVQGLQAAFMAITQGGRI